jgi:glycosyltransferase involved in cell wall biosynthesis
MKPNQLVLIVSIAKLDDIVIKTIEKSSGAKCIELFKYLKPERVSDLKRHYNCLILALKAVKLRKRVTGIVFWQQFIGLYYNLLCYLLLLRSIPKSLILTVIYIRRIGKLGKVYHKFFELAFNSKYIEKLICHSSSERTYYLNNFGKHLDKKIIFCKLGEGIKLEYFASYSENKYFFSGGSSNRDYETLIKAFTGIDEQLVIACKPENIGSWEIPKNVKIIYNAYDENFINLIKNSYSIILPIKDPSISSGQLVLLNGMKLGKSSIVTGGNCMIDYTDKDYSIEVVPNSADSIKKAVIHLSNNQDLNNLMAKNAYKAYCENYSIDKYAERISILFME